MCVILAPLRGKRTCQQRSIAVPKAPVTATHPRGDVETPYGTQDTVVYFVGLAQRLRDLLVKEASRGRSLSPRISLFLFEGHPTPEEEGTTTDTTVGCCAVGV